MSGDELKKLFYFIWIRNLSTHYFIDLNTIDLNMKIKEHMRMNYYGLLQFVNSVVMQNPL